MALVIAENDDPGYPAQFKLGLHCLHILDRSLSRCRSSSFMKSVRSMELVIVMPTLKPVVSRTKHSDWWDPRSQVEHSTSILITFTNYVDLDNK